MTLRWPSLQSRGVCVGTAASRGCRASPRSHGNGRATGPGPGSGTASAKPAPGSAAPLLGDGHSLPPSPGRSAEPPPSLGAPARRLRRGHLRAAGGVRCPGAAAAAPCFGVPRHLPAARQSCRQQPRARLRGRARRGLGVRRGPLGSAQP